MTLKKQLKRFKIDYKGTPQTRYIHLMKPDLTNLKASEKDVIDRVIEQYTVWSQSAITEYSKKDLPLQASADEDIINYELTLYREDPYSVRNYDENSNR